MRAPSDAGAGAAAVAVGGVAAGPVFAAEPKGFSESHDTTVIARPARMTLIARDTCFTIHLPLDMDEFLGA